MENAMVNTECIKVKWVLLIQCKSICAMQFSIWAQSCVVCNTQCASHKYRVANNCALICNLCHFWMLGDALHTLTISKLIIYKCAHLMKYSNKQPKTNETHDALYALHANDSPAGTHTRAHAHNHITIDMQYERIDDEIGNRNRSNYALLIHLPATTVSARCNRIKTCSINPTSVHACKLRTLFRKIAMNTLHISACK